MIGSKIIGKYRNGNYNCIICDDGSKIRYNDADFFAPEFPESMDVKISNKCNGVVDKNGIPHPCEFCHEKSHPNGKLANLNHPIFDSIHSGVEIAIGGGNLLTHPDLVPFLERMRARNVICNITLHLSHFEQAAAKVKYWHDVGLVHGVGISVNTIPTDYQLTLLRSNFDFVVHVIAGVVPIEAMQKMYDCGLKLLILGYKNYGRGQQYLELHPEISAKIAQFEALIPEFKNHFKLLSFDNLALSQLHIKNYVPEEVWNTSYMGEDGQFTMYLDMCEEQYAKSSTSNRKSIFSNDIRDLFAEVRNEKENF